MIIKSYSQQGFSLIEVMLAIFMLAFALLALAKLNTQMEVSAEKNMQRLQALQLAEMKLELLYAATQQDTNFAQIGEGCDEIGQAMMISHRLAGGNNCQLSTNSPYIIEWTVSAVGDLDDLKAVEVTVVWQDRWQEMDSLSLRTQLLYTRHH